MPAAVAEVGTEIVTDVIKQAVEKQMEIIAEAQEKAEAFVGKKVSFNKAIRVFIPTDTFSIHTSPTMVWKKKAVVHYRKFLLTEELLKQRYKFCLHSIVNGGDFLDLSFVVVMLCKDIPSNFLLHFEQRKWLIKA